MNFIIPTGATVIKQNEPWTNGVERGHRTIISYRGHTIIMSWFDDTPDVCTVSVDGSMYSKQIKTSAVGQALRGL